MKPSPSSIIVLLFAAALASAMPPSQAQAPDSPPPPAQLPPLAKDPANNSIKDAVLTKKKPKKVWTNDEISSVKGDISVVGGPTAKEPVQDSPASDSPANQRGLPSDKQISDLRDRLLQLRTQLEIVDKQISGLQNFQAEDSSASGGINMKQRYSSTPPADQLKQLEEKKTQIQAQIDAMEELARKAGIEPGRLR